MLAASFCSYVGIAILEEKGSQDWLVLQVPNINKQCLNGCSLSLVIQKESAAVCSKFCSGFCMYWKLKTRVTFISVKFPSTLRAFSQCIGFGFDNG